MSGPKGFDFAAGIPISKIPEGSPVAGHVGKDEIVVVRNGDECFAIGAHCTHYHGPLADGLIVGDTIRCPWHHACFNFRTGEAVRAPALDPVDRWKIERDGEVIRVRERVEGPQASQKTKTGSATPRSIVIIGGGAAGLACADMLRRESYDGTITMLSADTDGPVDRPNLSKDYLAGTAKDDWIPLRGQEFYSDNSIDLQTNTRVDGIEVKEKRVRLASGKTVQFDALLLATGAEPVRLKLEGAPSIPVHYLRTFADSKAIVATAENAKRALVIGASFIGLEVAASLQTRGCEVHVVAPEKQPLEKILGADVGKFIRDLHQSKGVVFHLGSTVSRLDGRTATLSDGSTLDADFVVVGVGVKPNVGLAEAAGLKVDNGVVVNEYLETSAPGIFAAGDIARWPDPHSGGNIRVEHWVVAERLGQVAARNMLGAKQRFDLVPFFWSQHYDISLNYVGHAEKWDAADVDGKLDDHDATVTYKQNGRVLAVATVFRDKESLEAEAKMELIAQVTG